MHDLFLVEEDIPVVLARLIVDFEQGSDHRIKEIKSVINPDTLDRGLKYLSAMMEAYTTVTMLPFANLEDINKLIPVRGCPSRFIMKPVLAMPNYFLVIIDTQEFEFTIIGGDTSYNNRLAQDQQLREVVTSLISKSIPATTKMKLVDTKVTNYFHSFYDIVYLLMSVYYMARIWKYADRIPRYMMYRKRDFRRYCYNLCAKYSMECYYYNMSYHMIRPDGSMRRGAMQTMIASLPFERSVVKLDQCPFYGRRGFKNLGRLMAADHGGQAEFASHQHFQ